MMQAENTKKLFIFSILTISIIGTFLIFSSEVMALVEPHITITMEPGQTTKPFQIKDDQGTDVFAVDVDGTITGSTSEMLVSSDTITTVSANKTQTNPLVLSKWQITKSRGIDLSPRLIEAALIGSGRVTSGTGFILLEFQRSTDDITYATSFSLSTNDSVFTQKLANANPFNLQNNVRFYRVVMYNTDGATTGEWESFKVWIEQMLPATYSMQKIG